MKLENVVNPPRIPTNTNVRWNGDMCRRPPAIRPASTPMTSDPMTLTVAVAYGVVVSVKWASAAFTPCRASDPSAPPRPTAIHVISRTLHDWLTRAPSDRTPTGTRRSHWPSSLAGGYGADSTATRAPILIRGRRPYGSQ